MTPITFKHRYHKLASREFTTIRGSAQFKRLHRGDRVEVQTPDETFPCEIMALELKRVADMTVVFLKADAEYPGFEIRDRQDFVDLLNSFRAPMWKQVTMDGELTIITLRRCG